MRGVNVRTKQAMRHSFNLWRERKKRATYKFANCMQNGRTGKTVYPMRAVVQRVSRASVRVDGEIVGAIERGLLVLLGVGQEDGEIDAEYLAEKVAGLRIFEDESEKMNRSVQDVGGAVLAVSQFTLYGDVRKGKRPSFDAAARPERAKELYEHFAGRIRGKGIRCETGIFQAMMQVELVNDGPVTILLDSEKLF
jgi:D-tyrosyl-tRNA(Tyr) deacylase